MLSFKSAATGAPGPRNACQNRLHVEALRAGQMFLIPKGIIHRSMLCPESEAENVLLELKIRDELTYVGDRK